MVSVYNLTADIKVVKTGTTLTCTSPACNGLNYISEGDLNLGPGSSGEVKVTAVDIGENYNVGPTTRFKVGSFNPTTEVLASNVKNIAGGTTKTIVKIVQAQDLKDAEKAALEDLKNTLKTKITVDPANANFEISAPSLKIESTGVISDVKEGDQAEIVNVTVNAKATVDAVQKDKILEVASAIKTEVVPEGYKLDEKVSSLSAVIASQTPQSIDISVKLIAVARLDVNMDKLKNDLAGKKYSDVDSILSAVPHSTGYTKNYSPQTLPQFFWSVPENKNRIEINLVGE
jgi:hypothetical protein